MQYSEETLKLFEKELNDMFGEVEICGNKFESGSVLRKIAPWEFNAQLADYIQLYGELE